jgi:rare lipoprotein A
MRLRTALILIAVLFAALLSSACGKRKVKVAKPPRMGSTETGIASWYGHPYHGRQAANGEIYDMERMTAAHKTLPFETWVRVRNLSNGKTVDVRIQDRGPFVRGRIIDLSRAAARSIDLIGPGITKVKLTIIAPPKEIILEKQPELFTVQTGAFRDRSRAEALAAELERFGRVHIVERAANPPVFRVLVGEEETEAGAQALAELIRGAGHQAFVVRFDRPDNTK